MLNDTHFLFQNRNQCQAECAYGEENRISQAARALWGRARLAAQWLGWLPGARALPVLRRATQRAGHSLGLRTVRLKAVVGTVGRPADFDAQFRPLTGHLEHRWLRVATALLNGVALPPVTLVQVGGTYYVEDGHHRISAMRALGLEEVEAEVTVWS